MNNSKGKDKLASDLDLSKYTIAKYLTGEREPGFDILCKLATYFGTSIDYIIGYSDIKNIDEHVLIESIKSSFKNYPSNILNIVDTVCSIINEKDNISNLDSLNIILKELYKALKK